METVLSQLYENVIEGEVAEVREIVERCLAESIPAGEILQEGLIRAMEQVGVLYSQGEIFVPEMLIAAKAMHIAMEALKPELISQDVQSEGTVVIGTVEGDLHDIGKNLVALMLEGGGYSVIDLGVDVSPDQFIEAIHTHSPDIVGLSALLTTTMSAMEEIVSKIKMNGLNEHVKVIIGGAPVTPEFAKEIGADGYAEDAGQAVQLIKQMIM